MGDRTLGNDPRAEHAGRDAHRRTDAPILIIQGDADPIVAPDVTARLAHKLCAEGETVDVRILKGTAHLDAGHVAVPDVVRWIADRFAGKPPPTTCT